MSSNEPAAARGAARGAWSLLGRSLIALGIGVALWAVHLPAASAYPPFLQLWLLLVDPLLGVSALVLVLGYGQRHPLAVAVAAAALALASEIALGPAALALAAVSARQRWRSIVAAGAALAVAMLFSGLPYPSSAGISVDWWVRVLFNVIVVGAVVAIGVAVGQRRAVLAGLRERAEAVEREQAAREQAVRAAERARIAHDMHDVLAHRISLVAMHAAAVGYRADLSDAERTSALTAIEQNARAALSELRDVLGVLREPTDVEAAPAPPQPGMDGIDALVAEGRSAGMGIEFVREIDGDPPPIVAQAAYRLVREALSNARKHAPDAAVTVSIAGEDGEGLAVMIDNDPPALLPAAPLPGSGMGLVGMAERVEATGGRFHSGPRPDGGYTVTAWIPWST